MSPVLLSHSCQQFGYKQKAQTFPIRKVQTVQEAEAEIRPAAPRRPAPAKNAVAAAADDRSAAKRAGGSGKVPKDSGKDFVRRNAQKVSGKRKEGPKDVNTIALTQDQLNAILKTIGQVTGSENVASVEIGETTTSVS